MCLPARVVDGIEDRHRPAQVRQACRREFDPAGTADQKVDAEFALELADLLGQRRLGHVQPVGGPAEVEFLGDGAEIAEVTQFHD